MDTRKKATSPSPGWRARARFPSSRARWHCSLRHLALCLAVGLLGACTESAPIAEPVESSDYTGAEFLAQQLDAAESMERLAAERRARETHPGRTVYERACATCHETGVAKAPHTGMLGMMTSEAVLRSITSGVMKAEALALTDTERAQVAVYLAGSPLGQSPVAPAPICTEGHAEFDRGQSPLFVNWGIDSRNTRLLPRAADPVRAEDLPDLTLRWAFAVPGANRIRSQPALAGGAVFFGGQNAKVYAIDALTGCIRWTFDASGEVRTGLVVEPFSAAATTGPLVFFGDVLGNVYAANAWDGTLRWRDRPDGHPNSTITGTPSYHQGRLYVPVSALDAGPPADPAYECCKFRGSVVAYDAHTGELIWQTHTVSDAPAPTQKNRAGTQMYGPSGAAVWNAPAIDVARNQLYVGTAENLSSPATKTSDAVFAMDLDTGEVRWTFQGTPNDAWNGACGTINDANCPAENGPDYDMAAGIILARLSDGRELVVGGQKSGVVHALDPDTGQVVWQNAVGRGGVQGGIHFGMATEGDALYVPVTDMPDGRAYTEPARPGLYALDMKSGEFLWKQPAPTDVCEGRAFCHPGISQAVTAAPGLVMAGAMDGVLRIHDAEDGLVLWQFDTTQTLTALSGAATRGGSLGGGAGPVSGNGMLYVSSGYGLYFHMPGNALLAFGPPLQPNEQSITGGEQ
ncbi:MAG: hypothetical protein CMQ49_06460 [Gammaproteobacteria bacterium]|nr:hypothetical protein [Gammaproteobacteria bacterium]